MVADLEVRHGRTDRIHDADAFMTQNAANRTGRHITLQDMQVGAADRGLGDPHDRIRRRGYFRFGPFLKPSQVHTFIDERSH